MSDQAIPVPQDCCSPCIPQGLSSTPGPQGPPGADGTNGTNGIDAFSFSTTGTDTMPDEQLNVTITVTPTSEWMTVGQVVFVQFWGYMEVVSKPNSSTVELKNLEDTGTGAYTGNAAMGAVLAAGAEISPAGLQGPTSSVPGGTYFAIANNLSEGTPATMRSNLGLGTSAMVDIGVLDGQLAPNDGNLTAGQALFATATGEETKSATDALAALGIVIGTADTNIPPVDAAAGLIAGDIVVATAAGVETKTAAQIRTLLGVTAQDMLMFCFIGANGGAFATSGGGVTWATCPINTEVVDTGSYGSLAGNQMTLAAGTYRFEFGLVASGVDHFYGRLYNVTDAGVVINTDTVTPAYSVLCNSTAELNQTSIGVGRFTLGGAKAIELQGLAESTGTFGAGFVTFGGSLRFSWVTLWRE